MAHKDKGINWQASFAQDKVNPDTLNRIQWILENCKGLVLDVGVGFGHIGNEISKKFDYIGFETSSLMLKFIEENYHELNIFKQNFLNLRAPTQLAPPKIGENTILLAEVLEHYEDFSKFFRRACYSDRILVTLPLQKYCACADHVWDITAHIIEDKTGVPAHLCIRMDKKKRIAGDDFWDLKK